MKDLNKIRGFTGLIKNDGNCFKLHVCGENFWVRDCNFIDGQWKGIVDNDLMLTDKHGLCYNDEVKFMLIE